MTDKHLRRLGQDYGTALLSLLPRGQAWPKYPGSTLDLAVRGIAEYWGFVDGRAADLLERESDPRYTLELLPDWERNWGLPDPCYDAPQTIGERRLALYMRMTMLGAQSREFFIGIAEMLGYTITISEYRTFVVGIDRVGDARTYGGDIAVALPPLITSPSDVALFENSRLALTLVSDQYVAWVVTGGPDGGQFQIVDGILQWLGNTTKDFERPDDADTNNVYTCIVRATAYASGLFNEQTINVIVRDSPGDWVTSFIHPFSPGSQTTSGWSNYNMRQRIPNVLITASGDAVRLTLLSGLVGTEGMQIDDCRIGYAAATGDLTDLDTASPIAQIKVGGATTFEWPANSEIVTDPVAFPFDATRDPVITFHFSKPAADATQWVELAGAVGSWKLGATSEAGVADVTGYTYTTSMLRMVKKIEVLAGTRVREDSVLTIMHAAAPSTVPMPMDDDPITRNEWGNPIMDARGDAFVKPLTPPPPPLPDPIDEDQISEWPYYGLGPETNRHYWTVFVQAKALVWFRCGSGQCGVDPHLRIGVATDLECLLNRWKPAHTEIIFNYEDVASVELSANALVENSPVGTHIGIMSIFGGTGIYAFSLTDDAGGRVQITASNLEAGTIPTDYETTEEFTVGIHADNGEGHVIDSTLTILVYDSAGATKQISFKEEAA